jgi:hypothetical protein
MGRKRFSFRWWRHTLGEDMALFSFITDPLFGKPPAAPAAPDYTGAAIAQGAANKETAVAQARLNNPNIYSPYGNQTVTWGTPDATGVSQPTINQTLTPEAQRALTAQQNLQANLATLGGQSYGTAFDVMSKPFDYRGQVQTSLDTSGIAKMPVNAGTTGQEAIMSRLEPSLAKNRVSTETQLINQGLRPGSEAYDNAIKLLGQQENDARTQAALQGINLDTAANAQGFNQALQGGQFGNTAQQQALAQAITQRQLPLNEINALMSGSQIQNPTFSPYSGSNIAPPPIANATAQQGAFDQNTYNQQMGSYNQNVAGLYGLGGAAAYGLAKSDRRLKSNINRIGTHKLGIGIYEYDIEGKHEIGVMAQEVEQVMPEAVIHHPDGYMMVQYGRINA